MEEFIITRLTGHKSTAVRRLVKRIVIGTKEKRRKTVFRDEQTYSGMFDKYYISLSQQKRGKK